MVFDTDGCGLESGEFNGRQWFTIVFSLSDVLLSCFEF